MVPRCAVDSAPRGWIGAAHPNAMNRADQLTKGLLLDDVWRSRGRLDKP